MLVYTTILLVSLVLGTISVFIYRAVSNSSRSVYSSKQQVGTISGTPGQQKDKVVRAVPTERFPGGSQANAIQLGAQPHGHGTGVGKVSHCSLFDVNATTPEVEHGQVSKPTPREVKLDTARTIPGNTQGCSLYSS